MSPLKRSIFLLLAMWPALAWAQRLPQGVVPEHYDLTFSPDLTKATFTGEETIDVKLAARSTSVTLNALELEIQEASITQGDKTQAAKAQFHPEKEQITLAVADAFEPGPAVIRIKFRGILNDKLRGFYLAKTRLRNYAVTQFESTDARRAFPSFDEPALKAKFDVTLIIDRDDTAISNGYIKADVSGPGPDKHTVKFSTTPPMSTYLVAMAVGDFQCSEGSADNIPIRVCGTPDKKPLHAAALRYAEEILKYYNQYYGVPYPFKKLDIVGAPDFEAGAMENTGAIFYRESLLFIDDNNSSVKEHQLVFEVLAHEMAHQWFGDLVTMKWWDNIWLNEGFATWMALKPSQSLHPEWNAALDAVTELNDALTVDSLRNTHPIRSKAETPEEINELFDHISYQKGAAVLRMVESYVSPEVFRRGVNAYLRKFSYANASAEDFWSSMTLASGGLPVNRIMPTFVDQAGQPLVSVKTSCTAPPAVSAPARKSRRSRRAVKPHPKTEIAVSQQRFWPDGAPTGNRELWVIPVCVKAESTKPFCQIFSQPAQTLPIAGCSSWVFTNANASGYYRTQYDSASLQHLSSVAATQLTTSERISLLNDESALLGPGKESVARYLELVGALSQDAERTVAESYSLQLRQINDRLLTESNEAAFRSWIRTTFSPMFAKIGWAPSPGESDDLHLLRSGLIALLGGVGRDEEVVRRSVELARQYVKDSHAMDPSIAGEVLKVAAQTNDASLFEGYQTALRDPGSTPEVISNVSTALAEFTDPQLVSRWLEIASAPETRNQDSPGYFARSLRNADAQKVAWPWIKEHWSQVESKLTMSSGVEIVAATGDFCTVEMRDDVQKFFSEHKVPSSERTLKQSLERINACVGYRERQQTNLNGWLAQHNGTVTSGRR